MQAITVVNVQAMSKNMCLHMGLRERTFQSFHFKIAVSLLTSP